MRQASACPSSWRSPTHESEPEATNPEQSLRETEEWWTTWSDRCTFQGEWREAVVRSLITLKALTYAPTGGIVAAATTSLPEASAEYATGITATAGCATPPSRSTALKVAGYTEEAVRGENGSCTRWPERLRRPDHVWPRRGAPAEGIRVEWLTGYEGAGPVRIGNAATEQHQLDVYGEVLDSMYLAHRVGTPPSELDWRVQRMLMVSSKPSGTNLMRGSGKSAGRAAIHAFEGDGVGGDRPCGQVRRRVRPRGPGVECWQIRHQIHEEVCHEGYNPAKRRSFNSYGSRIRMPAC